LTKNPLPYCNSILGKKGKQEGGKGGGKTKGKGKGGNKGDTNKGIAVSLLIFSFL
jgi:hypothetical protein